MKHHFSLKWVVALSFLTLVIVLVIGYSLLSAHFFVRGMDNIIASNMADVVESYVAAVPAAERQGLQSFSGYQISSVWQQMPEQIRAFREPGTAGVLLKYNDSGWFTPPDVIHFVMRVNLAGHSYFISRSVSRETVSPLVGRNANQSLRFLVLLSLVILIIVSVIIWLIFKQISRPVNALGQWARDLNKNKLKEIPPDFSYPELNRLAELIRLSLSSVQESLEREHRFLRHSSHELRTPISVIRNNVELLGKLREKAGKDWEPRQAQVIERIDRASLTMKHLTETLLWLSRESEEHLPVNALDLAELIRELVAEARYLLKDKEVEVVVETEPYTLTVAGIAARIVLGNLIRNAFQHTWQGTVCISQKEGRVKIVNDLANEHDKNRDLGFGLGLQLTEQLAQKLHWSYSNNAESGRHCAIITIG